MTPSDPMFWVIVLGGMLRLATPIALAALGETLSERAGVLNLGIDGIMTAGAFAALVGAAHGGWIAGLLSGMAAGAGFGLLMAGAVVGLGASQIITGIAVSLIGAGLTSYLFQLWQPSGSAQVFVDLAPDISVPVLSRIPGLGPVLFAQNSVTYVGFGMVVILALVLRCTRAGLVLRAVGDAASAARLRGIATGRVRAMGVIAGAALMGLGGATITVGFLGSFNEGISAGRGYVALAVVIIGRWSPAGAFLGAFLFAFFDSLSLRVQGGFLALPSEIYSMLPYAMTLAVLALSAGRRSEPRELGR